MIALARVALVLIPLLALGRAAGSTLLVDPTAPTPQPPFNTWATAAHTIQAACDAALAGDRVLVTNGIYNSGGQVIEGLTNRLLVTKAVSIESVNGPEYTTICGYQMPAATNGPAAIRCVYLAKGAALVGFSLTNGGTLDLSSATQTMGGGVYCEDTTASVSNCWMFGNSAAEAGAGGFGGDFYNCLLRGNFALFGGGLAGAHGTDCIITNNSAEFGGGTSAGSLTRCLLANNRAVYGGGADRSTLLNCKVMDNFASLVAGGFYADNGGLVQNSLLTRNRAGSSCGATYMGTFQNCTITANHAPFCAGANGATLNNCILYYNDNQNYAGGTFTSCCTTPLPPGSGNIEMDPELAGPYQLSLDSPCRGAGVPFSASGVDIDGEPWALQPSIGCDEVYSGSLTGAIHVAIITETPAIATGFAATFFADTQGRLTESHWEFDDGVVISNRPVAVAAWLTAGDHFVKLWAYNEDNPAGVSTTLTIHVIDSPVYYVAQDSPNPQPPFNSWATAAQEIQAAVDAAIEPGALVLVSNGVYSTGGRVVTGALTNRVIIDHPITVQSVNGPAVTTILGYQEPQTNNGPDAVRCVFLANGAMLSGFTLTGGATLALYGANSDQIAGGGAWCLSSSTIISNCIISSNTAYWEGGGVRGGTIVNSTFNGNSAGESGGGVAFSSLSNCLLTLNSSYDGGSAYLSTLANCVLASNSAGYGGGCYGGYLYWCQIISNSASMGGGVCGATANNCLIRNNTADRGGGAGGGTMNNCAILENIATSTGGGLDSGQGVNCTVLHNTARTGGGASGASFCNSIIYYNNADSFPNCSAATLNYCCTTPQPIGTGNITNEPQLETTFHLSAASPCRGAGSAACSSGLDIDGESFLNPPSIGCDEYVQRLLAGPLEVHICTPYTNVPIAFPIQFAARFEGEASGHVWDFGDGVRVTNNPYASHAWESAGDYPVVLTAFNDSHPDGVSDTVHVQVLDELVYHVSSSSETPWPPYSSWQTAAKSIQDALDCSVPGVSVLVTNGVYDTGGTAVSPTMTNRVAITRPIEVRSVNGPEVTRIEGYQIPNVVNGPEAIRGVYLTNGAVLNGFTVANGATHFLVRLDAFREEYGGGVWCESQLALITNCVLEANSARSGGAGVYNGRLVNCIIRDNSTQAGGGGGTYGSQVLSSALAGNFADAGGAAWLSALENCTLQNNAAASYGGACLSSTLLNCTVVQNSAGNVGGGVYDSSATNTILYYNWAPTDPDFSTGTYGRSILDHACSSSLPQSGAGNFTDEPLFVDWPGGDLHIQSNSPCINSGLNFPASAGFDLDGSPRISGGTVDVGAYEVQNPASLISYAWLQQFGLPNDGSADFADPDHDGLNNWQEWVAGTDPTNAASVLQITSAVLSDSPTGPGLVVTWKSQDTRTYYLQRSADLTAFITIQDNIAGQAGTTSYTDTNAVSPGQFFYRVGVRSH